MSKKSMPDDSVPVEETVEPITPPPSVPALLPTRARVLVDSVIDGKQYRSGELVEASGETLRALAGAVDTHPDAVAYIEAHHG